MTTPANNALEQGMVQYEGAIQAIGQYTDNEIQDGLTAEENALPSDTHPDAASLFSVCPWMRHIPIFGEACEAFGPKCVVSLGLCYLLCKGIADQILGYARYPMLTERFGIDAARYQRLAGISTMGWSVKAFTALLCDTFAFLGYTKRWYMAMSCVVGGVLALGYALLPAKPSSANIAAAFIFLSSFGKANVDILSEGHYSRLIRKVPKAGPALISWIWWFIMSGSLVAAAIQGPVADLNIPQVGVFISAALQIVTVVFFIFNWYGERPNRIERAEDARKMHADLLRERQKALEAHAAATGDGLAPAKNLHPEDFESDDEHEQGREAAVGDALALDDAISPSNGLPLVMAKAVDEDDFEIPVPYECLCGVFEMNSEGLRRNWKIAVYSVVMTCSVLAMALASILGNTITLLIVALSVSLLCCGMSFWALPLVIAKTNIFGYLQMVVYLQIPGATDTFYLASPDCLPDGPHFSKTFYNTIAAVIATIGALAGVTAFNYIFSKRSYYLTFIITTIIQVLASVFDIIMVKRWNVDIGIPDHAMYILGDAIVYQVCYMLGWMPMVMLLSRLCPRGSESVVFALMAGFFNLGQTTSSAIGAILMELVWPVKSQVPCDFSNVPWLLLVGHMLLPLMNIPFAILLLPSARICDDIDVDGKVVQKEAAKMADAGSNCEGDIKNEPLENNEGGVRK